MKTTLYAVASIFNDRIEGFVNKFYFVIQPTLVEGHTAVATKEEAEKIRASAITFLPQAQLRLVSLSILDE